jgi:hypothetical protein
MNVAKRIGASRPVIAGVIDPKKHQTACALPFEGV